MKRWVKGWVTGVLVGVGVLGGASCTQQQTAALPAGLQGTYDLALVNDLLFVTSTDRNELRVLRLTADATTRGFVRAPNPLEPLAIPVLPRPQALTRDARYDGDGNEQPGAYVYARSSGSALISVVAAANEQLDEVARLDTRQLSQGASSGPVTAFSALAASAEGGASTLYYATQESTGARVWRVSLPNDPQALAATPPTAELLLALTADEAVSALLVLPDAARIAVATRRGQPGTPGTSFLLDVNTRTRGQALDFGGSQVLQLATHGRVPGEDARPERRAPGARIFGVLDPSNCTQLAPPTSATTCASGILAVDTATGTRAQDFTGYPMLPINSGTGLAMGLSLSTSTKLSVQGGETRDTTVPLLGIVPLSTGAILFFDGLELVDFNVGAIWASGQTVNTATASVALIDPLGNNVDPAVPDRAADIAFSGTFGVTPSETYVLTSQGVLPGASRLVRDPARPTSFTVPLTDAVEDGVSRSSVRVGDVVVVSPELESLPACPTELTVTDVQRASPTASTAVLVTSGTLADECADYTRFSVRAAGEQSLVLAGGSTGGYLRRMGTRSVYTRSAAYFFHPPGYAGQTEGTAVSLTITRDLRQSPVARDLRYVVTTASHFFPFILSVDLVSYDGIFRSFRLPGPVVRARVGETDFAYIVYPSANGVLQMNLTTVAAGAANSLGLVPFR